MARRCGLLTGVLLAGSLPPGLLAATGWLGRELDPLRWAALFAPAATAALLLAACIYLAARGAAWPPLRRSLAAAGGLLLVWSGLLAIPPLLFPRLSPAAARLLQGGAASQESLRQRAMLHPDPRRRLQAAWSYYLQTGEAVPYLDGRGRPALFEPTSADRERVGVPAWLAPRPGALAWERRVLAVGTALLIALALAGLALAAALGRRHGLGHPGPVPPV